MYRIGYLNKVGEHDVGLELEEALLKVVLGQLTNFLTFVQQREQDPGRHNIELKLVTQSL